MRPQCYVFITPLVALLALSARVSVAVPLERFESPVDLECAHDTACTKTVRSKFTLGGTTGLVLVGGNEGEAKLVFRQDDQRRLELTGKGEALHSLALRWDGDSNPEVLSAAGLACFDLTALGATAFVLRDFSMLAECAESGDSGECQQLEIESRVFDADDPTGQRYSAALLRQPVPRVADELVVPFSNFTREGPRGLARLSCVGAISIAFRLQGFKNVSLSVGPIYTNDTNGLTYVPTPTPSPSASPTVTPSSTALPEDSALAVDPSIATADQTAAAPEEALEIPSGAARLFATPSGLEVFEDEQLESVIPRIPEEGSGRAKEAPGIVLENNGEIVYGEVLAKPRE